MPPFTATPVPICNCAGAAKLNAVNTFEKDNHFKSGTPWADVKGYGAMGDGLTDDTAAIQAAIDAIETIPGSGTVFIPPSDNVYKVSSSLMLGHGTRLVGGSISHSVLSACGNDTIVVTHDGGYGAIENLAIYGKGANADTGSFGASQPALLLNDNFVHGRVSHIAVVGGYHAIRVRGNDCALQHVTATTAYGHAAVRVDTGCWFYRVKVDHSTPLPTLPAPFAINPWAPSTSYPRGIIVSTQGYLIQCTSAVSGTSGTVAPTLKNYELDITDNTATWRLVSPANYYGINVDTDAAEVSALHCDISGFYTAGLTLTNSLGGNAPSDVKFSQGIIGGAYGNAVLAVAGANLTLEGNTIGGCLAPNAQGIYTAGTWAGIVRIVDNLIVGSPTNIEIGAGINTTITNNHIYGSTNAGINIDPSISKFIISENFVGSHPKYGANVNSIRVNNGSSDYYVITNNIVSGATNPAVQDLGSGTHKNVSNNL